MLKTLSTPSEKWYNRLILNEPLPVFVPLINPNEPEALLAALFVQEGQWVEIGEVLGVLETTKSTAELITEGAGYISGLRWNSGETIPAGEIFCWLGETPGQPLPVDYKSQVSDETPVEKPSGVRITRPAFELARSSGIDIDSLPKDRLVTEKYIRSLLVERSEATIQQRMAGIPIDANTVILFGGGGHAKMLIELIQAGGKYQIAGILDDKMTPGATILGVPVLGGSEGLSWLHAQGIQKAVNAVGGIGNVDVRIKVFDRLAAAGFEFPVVVHPSAVVEPSASLSPGSQVFARAYIGGEAKAGFGVIVSTGAIVSHDCILGDYAIISPGAILAGEVKLGPGVLLGMGVTINLRVNIGARARIGNNTTINEDVMAGGIVQAGSIWPAKQ
jgi:acetyltransferase EpsM